ncbi:putative helicase MOV-10, partial [Gonioctena quinquepunctata]
FFNIQEIEEVVGYLSKLIGSRVNGMQITTEHIGVITPYRKQAEKMRAACAIKQWKSLLVGSVEQFQGKEKLIIIISTVRSKNSHKFEEIDKTCQLGFLKNPKRFNVALTRARALLIVIGNANVLKADSNWSNFIRYSVDNKSLAGKRFNLNDDEE